MFEQFLKKERKIAVIGLGYVGLPIALEFSKKFSVIGFDINSSRIELMKKKIDPSNEVAEKDFDDCDIFFSSEIDDLKTVSLYIVAVPTPIDENNSPDLKPLLAATETVGKVLKKNDVVVFESTVYPGCTEEDCVPVLEKISGLNFGEDFKVGYSPERINPGDKEHTLTKIKKVVSGCDEESLELISKIYSEIISAGIHKAPSIKVAEAAKIIENTQRDVNIALMNELSVIFNKMNINTFDVLEAAGTKWNFLKFFPGLVGGHCIGVDPYYLTYKASEIGYQSKVILAGRSINDSMGAYIAKQIVTMLVQRNKNLTKSKVLIMGTTFKENVSDIRNSKVADIINELKKFDIQIEVTDPHASSDELLHEYGFSLVQKISSEYDCIVIAVNHNDYILHNENYFSALMNADGFLIDVKGIYRNKIKNIGYWSL